MEREGGWSVLAEGWQWWEVTARHLRQGVISMSAVHAPRAGPQNLSHWNVTLTDKDISNQNFLCGGIHISDFGAS